MKSRQFGWTRLLMGLLTVLSASLPQGATASVCPPAPEWSQVRSAFTAVVAKLQHREPVYIVAIGSSSTEGVGASSPREAYPHRLQVKLAERWRTRTVVRNEGRSGEIAAATAQRLETLLAGGKPDLVIWQVGTNDVLRGERPDKVRAALERGLAAARLAEVEMILVDPQYVPSFADPNRYERQVQLVGDVAARRQVSLLSRFALMRAWANHAPKELAASLSQDGLHMSDRGYECLADLLAAMLPRRPPDAGLAAGR